VDLVDQLPKGQGVNVIEDWKPHVDKICEATKSSEDPFGARLVRGCVGTVHIGELLLRRSTLVGPLCPARVTYVVATHCYEHYPWSPLSARLRAMIGLLQASHIQQAAFRLRKDRKSELKQRMATTTKFVQGGVQLVSALWSQSVSGVFEAVADLYATAKEFKDAASSANSSW
jgi:hypothetical protein